MPTIDFTKIRSTPKSRNDSFESLSVQLFKSHCSAPVDSTFISLRGDGGDGGVEAYYRLPTGEVYGVQAKYFFKLGASELRQINGSLDTALKNHPDLSKYWIYIPFNLTGRVAEGKRGMSEAERFENWKKKVEGDAATRGKSLKVTMCSESVIGGQLQELDQHGGMRRYWFDDAIMTTNQIEQCLEQAKAFAGPRYSSVLDIITSAHIGLDFFGGVGEFDEWREDALVPLLKEFRSLQGYGDKALNILGDTEQSRARDMLTQVVQLLDGLNTVESAAENVELACQLLSNLSPLLVEAREAQESEFYSKHGENSDTPGFRQFNAEYMCTFPAGDMDAARGWEDICSNLANALTSPELGAATTSSLLLVGPAGIGKTHSIVSAAYRRLLKGGFSLVVFGDDFSGGEPWEVLRSKLGFGSSLGRDTLFECLQTCADHTDLPFVVYIDALNESPRDARWKDKLPELLQQCKPYPGIKVCVSTRDTYSELVVDSRFPGFAFQHVGFAGKEFEALQAFANFYALDSEITPLFSTELSNPLFLHLACRTLKEEGKHTLDVSLPGFTALLESHLKHCDDLVRGRLRYSNPRNLVRAAMLLLVEIITNLPTHERTWEASTVALQSLVGYEISPEALLKELENEGLIILTAGESDSWLLRLGYQRYSDVLRAISLVESCKLKGSLEVTILASRLAKLTDEDEGLLEALAAVLPEKTGVEITKPELGLDQERANRLLIHALLWRSKTSIKQDITDHIYDALRTPGLWQDVYEAFFRLSLVPKHNLNAKNWLHPFMQKQPMVDRDVYLSIFAFKSFDNNGAVSSIINASLLADIGCWPEESRSLAIKSLAWLTSCADRRVRDKAAKGLTRIVGCQPNLAQELAETFQLCDDEYILESIVLAIYSACLLEQGDQSAYIAALGSLLAPVFDTSNVLIRDHVRLLGETLEGSAVPVEIQDQLSRYPKQITMPDPWPTSDDAKPLIDLENLPSNMKLWGDVLGPDFWRYKVEPRLRHFDLKTANITLENIACWVMVETLNFGYPGYQEGALQADRALSYEFGTGRGRKGYAERLGKKYYWISLHRLLGVLADNVPTKKSYSGRRLGVGYLWSLDVRKVDLTDVRDIYPEKEYPNEIIMQGYYTFPSRTSDLKAWVRQDDLPSHEGSVIRLDSNEKEWIALSSSFSDDDSSPDEREKWNKAYLGLYIYYTSVFVRKEDVQSTLKLDSVFDGTGASCYRGYLAEYPDGNVYRQFEDEGDLYLGSKGMIFSEITLSRGGEWEYDYSSDSQQEHLNVPSQDLVRQLGLTWDRQCGWVDSTGKLAAFDLKANGRRGLFVRRELLNTYLERTGNILIYRRFANKGFFDLRGDDGVQIDLIDYVQYKKNESPVVLYHHERPFNC